MVWTLDYVFPITHLSSAPRHWQFQALGKNVAALGKSNAGDRRWRH